jgi:PAS domain S-box-containing protein
MYNYFKKSITRQYMFSLILVVIFALVGAALLTGINYGIQEDLMIERQELKEKKLLVNEIEDHLMLMVFHARGYYFLQDDRELEFLHSEQDELLKAIRDYEGLKLDEVEERFVFEINTFLLEYNEEILLPSINHVRNNDYVSLRSLAFAGATDRVIDFVQQMQNFANEIDDKLNQINDKTIESVNFFKWLYVAYIILILFFLGIVIRKMSKNLGIPLLELTQASEQIVQGEFVQLTQVQRDDEIGVLSRAFQEMARSMQGKEEELTAQNEELLAQQETLEEQQDHLEKSLLELKYLNSALNESAIVVITDHKGIITYANEKFCEISQYSKEELLGKDHRIINSGSHSKQFFRDLWKTILKGNIWTGEIRNKAKDGSVYWVETTIVPYLNECGVPYQFIAIRKDITDKKIAEQKLKQSYEETEARRQLNQDIIDHVNEGISLFDEKGSLLKYNYMFTEIIGEKDNLHNLSFDEWSNLLHGRIGEFADFKSFMKKAIYHEGHEALTYRYEVLTPKKKVFDVYAVTIQRNNNQHGTLVVHRDITAEYEVDQMKSELVSTVSHELRTPLASVLGFAELMLTRELKPERQKKYLETIHKEATRLTNLINDFLDIQRMESGKQTYDKKTINVYSIIEDLIVKFKTTNKQHDFVLKSVEEQIEILGDEEKLIQLFTNLVSNAIKFSPDGGKITIRIEKRDNDVICAVTDQGLGIPTEEVSKLFQKFYRIDNSDRRKIGGTGLGLAICKQIVEAHHGDISVSSVLGNGSTFYVKLPALESIELTPKNTYAEHLSNDIPSLVIVEDDESLGMLLLAELKELKIDVTHFSDGESAVAAIRKRQPNLIVLDIMLGEKMDGWSVIEELKKEEKTKRIPIIISSALDEKERGRNLGIDHYLTKPYPHGKLSEVVLELLEIGDKTGKILVPIEKGETEENE